MYKSVNNPEISKYPPHMDIDDLVLYFHGGLHWLYIPLSNMSKYIVITTKLTDFISKESHKITIARCPVTGMATVLKGTYKLVRVDKNGLVLSAKKTEYRLADIKTRRWSCYVDALKNVLVTRPDGKFIVLDKIVKEKQKKICHVIEYYNGSKTKKIAVIGKDTPDVNNMRSNGTDDFLNKYSREIEIKMAIVTPIYCSYLDNIDIKKVAL